MCKYSVFQLTDVVIAIKNVLIYLMSIEGNQKVNNRFLAIGVLLCFEDNSNVDLSKLICSCSHTSLRVSLSAATRDFWSSFFSLSI